MHLHSLIGAARRKILLDKIMDKIAPCFFVFYHLIHKVKLLYVILVVCPNDRREHTAFLRFNRQHVLAAPRSQMQFMR